MFGTEKKSPEIFQYDLEKDLKKHPAKAKELEKQANLKIEQLKHLLRSDHAPSDTEGYHALLSAYAALKKVIHRLAQ